MDASTIKARTYLPLLATLVIGIFFIATIRQASPIETTIDGAILALNHIQEWAKWMTGIEIGGLAALTYILFEKESMQVRAINPYTQLFALSSFLLLSVALFISAWIFSSLSSHAIRIHALADINIPTIRLDIYESSAFGWTQSSKLTKWITLGYMLNLAQWLWALGLTFMGITVGRLIFSPRQ